MYTSIIVFVILIAAIVIFIVKNKAGKKTKPIKTENENIKELRSLFEGNIIPDDLIILPVPETLPEQDQAAINAYKLALNMRHIVQTNGLKQLDHSEYNLNIQAKEGLFKVLHAVEWYEEKVIRRDVAYSGLRWSGGLFRAGAFSYISNAITDFKAVDAGKIFITNKRIIFIGEFNNLSKSINIDSILTHYLYQDGVIILVPNRKAVLLKFQYQKPETGWVNDGLIQFVLSIDNILISRDRPKSYY